MSETTVNASVPAEGSGGYTIAAGSWAAWCIALRPRTFWIATIPMVVSSALAIAKTHSFHIGTALLALLASLLLQAITNLQNDVGYTTRGAETGRRIGLSRATANGWLAPAQVRTAIAIAVIVTLLVGAPIIVRAGWPAAAMGGASILAAIGYMGGPRPIAFTPLGELTVFVFFGLIAVLGSYYVQTGSVAAARSSPPLRWARSPPPCSSSTIIATAHTTRTPAGAPSS